jgi:hypothetical protein
MTRDGARGESNNFIFDSGASINVCNNLSLINNFRSFSVPRALATAGGHCLAIVGAGTMEGIGEVFYVPQLRRNLISIKQLTRCGAEVTFTHNRVFINDKLVGVLDDKLYSTAISRQCGPDSAVFASEEYYADDGHVEITGTNQNKNSHSLKLELLHKRFCHTNIFALKELIKCQACDGLNSITHQQSSPNSFHCEACAMAKATTQARDPTKKLRRNLSAVTKELYFQAVYTDVLGPMQVRAPGGYHYGITFTEMTSRYRYFYPLRVKSDALTAFKIVIFISK